MLVVVFLLSRLSMCLLMLASGAGLFGGVGVVLPLLLLLLLLLPIGRLEEGGEGGEAMSAREVGGGGAESKAKDMDASLIGSIFQYFRTEWYIFMIVYQSLIVKCMQVYLRAMYALKKVPVSLIASASTTENNEGL